MVFVQWVIDKAGLKPPIKTASCGAFLNAARAAGEVVYDNYQPNDVVIYDFPGGASTDHCGIVESVSGSTVVAIEGNTAVGADSDGGEVMRRTRNVSQIVGAWRPKEEEMNKEDFAKFMDEWLNDRSKERPANWSADSRKWAEDNGLIKGDDKGNLQYLSFVTREQLVVFLERIVEMLRG